MVGAASSSSDFIEPTNPPPPAPGVKKGKSFRFADDVNGSAPRRCSGQWQGAQIYGASCHSQLSSPNLCAQLQNLGSSQKVTSTRQDSKRSGRDNSLGDVSGSSMRRRRRLSSVFGFGGRRSIASQASQADDLPLDLDEEVREVSAPRRPRHLIQPRKKGRRASVVAAVGKVRRKLNLKRQPTMIDAAVLQAQGDVGNATMIDDHPNTKHKVWPTLIGKRL